MKEFKYKTIAEKVNYWELTSIMKDIAPYDPQDLRVMSDVFLELTKVKDCQHVEVYWVVTNEGTILSFSCSEDLVKGRIINPNLAPKFYHIEWTPEDKYSIKQLVN